jgi:hypothetical protein
VQCLSLNSPTIKQFFPWQIRSFSNFGFGFGMLCLSVSVSVQTQPKFWYFGFGSNYGFGRSLSESQHRTSQYIRSTKVILRTGLFWMNHTMCRVRPMEASPIEMTHKVINILITSIVTLNIKLSKRCIHFHSTFRLKMIGKKRKSV